MPNETKTLSPDTGLASDISVSDLGKLMGGEPIAPPVIPPAAVVAPVVPAPVVPVVADQEPTEVIADTPAVEPEKIIETEKPVETIQEPEKKSKEKWWDKRLSHSAEQRKKAEASLATETRRSEQLQRELDAIKTAQPGPVPPAVAQAPTPTGRPILATFVDKLKEGEPYENAVEAYTDALIAAALTSHDAANETARQKKAQAESQQTQQAAFAKDWQTAIEAHPDFDDVVERVRAGCPPALQVAVSQIQDDDGKALWPEITMYLDEHPATLAALTAQFAINPDAAKAKLGRISATLSPASSAGQAPKTTAPIPPVKKLALKPPTAVGGTAAPGLIDINDPKTSMDVFAGEMTKLGL